MLDRAQLLLDEYSERFPGNDLFTNAIFDLLAASGDDASYYSRAESDYRKLDLSVGDPLSVSDNGRVFRYAMASLLSGDNEVAADHFFWAAGGDEGIAAKTYDEIKVLKMLAIAYRRLGRTEDSDALLKQSLELAAGAAENGWDTPTLHARVAEIYAIQGDAENATGKLEQAFGKGWRRLSDIEYGIAWRGLQNDPRLDRIKVMILEDVERQRNALAANGIDSV
jgi:tetratricopeptide (TPR) repeat protein